MKFTISNSNQSCRYWEGKSDSVFAGYGRSRTRTFLGLLTLAELPIPYSSCANLFFAFNNTLELYTHKAGGHKSENGF